MQFGYNYHILLPLLALFIALVLIVRVWHDRTKPVTTIFLVLMSALAWWSLAVVLEHASLGLSAKIFWVKMSYFGIISLPPAWLVFTLQYADREKWLIRRNLAILTVLPVLTLVMVWTNDIYHLMWKEFWLDTSLSPPVDAVTHNIGFWVQAVYAYLLLLLGTLILLRVFIRSSAIYRKQVGTMLLATAAPWVANFLYIAGIGPFSVVDPTPFAFAISGIAFSWGLSRLQMLDIMPIAHEVIFTNMADGVIVLDKQNRITDINPAAERILGLKRSDTIGRPYGLVLPRQAGLLELKPEMSDTPSVISLGEGQTLRYYATYVSPINMRKHFGGHLVLLHDDTERRKAEVESRERVRLETELIERKRAEGTLKASEAKFRNLVENAAAGILTALPDGRILSANKAALEIYGYDSEQEFTKASALALYVSPDDRGQLLKLIEKRGVAKGFEVRMKHKDGTPFWASLNVITQIAESGERQLLSIIEDITERKRTEGALRESEERFRTILDSTADGILLADSETKRFYTGNQAICRLLGYSLEEIKHLGVADIHPEKDLPYVLEQFEKQARGEITLAKDIPVKRKDGSVFYAEISSAPVIFAGKTYNAGVFRDVTERRKSEANLKAQKELIDRILATTPNAVLVIAEDGKITLANRTFCEGFSQKAGSVEGKPLSQIMPVKELSDAILEAQTNGVPKLQHEFKYRLNGSERILVASILKMQKGETLLILTDVTDERERQERLYLTDRLASVGEMASGIAHELNNPLTSVIGLSQLLLDEEVPDSIKEDLGGIYSEAQRAAAVVKNMLTFARRHAPQRQATQLNRIIEDVLKLRAYEHRVNNIQVNTQFDAELPEIMGDYFQMQQVFLNITLNAEQAMIEAHKGGILTIATERVNSDVKVSFIDDGPGIAPENLSRIFNPFFTTKEVGKGTGLGLSICYGIVTNHGGKIYAKSELGKGATFVVELPIDAINEGRDHDTG